MWWEKEAQAISTYEAGQSFDPALMFDVPKGMTELNSFLNSPKTTQYLQTNPQKQYLLDKYLSTNNMAGLNRIQHEIDKHTPINYTSENIHNFSPQTQESAKALNSATFIPFLDEYTYLKYHKVLKYNNKTGYTEQYHKLAAIIDSPEGQKILQNAYANPENMRSAIKTILIKWNKYLTEDDIDRDTSKPIDKKSFSDNGLKLNLSSKFTPVPEKMEIIRQYISRIPNLVAKDDELKQIIDNIVRECANTGFDNPNYIQTNKLEKTGLRAYTSTLAQLIRSDSITNDTIRFLLDSRVLAKTSPGGASYGSFGENVLQKIDNPTWADYEKLFTRTIVENVNEEEDEVTGREILTASATNTSYAYITDLPTQEVNNILNLMYDPDESLISAKQLAKFTGYLSNSKACDFKNIYNIIENIDRFKQFSQYNVPNRICSAILKRPSNDNTNISREAVVKSKALDKLIKNHTKVDVSQDLDIEIDNTNPEEIKKMSAKIFNMGIKLTMFRSLGKDESSDSIFNNDGKNKKQGYDFPAGYLDKKQPFGRGQETDVYTKNTGYGVVYFSPTLEDGIMYKLAKSRQHKGGHMMVTSVPIQDLIEVRCLLGLEPFSYWHKELNAKNEDNWVVSMENSQPPKTLREALERIFRLYTTKEVMIPAPMDSDRYDYITTAKPDNTDITDKEMSFMPVIGEPTNWWLRIG